MTRAHGGDDRASLPRGPRRRHRERMTNDLHGKRIVILGGTSGIGLATARAAQAQGGAVVVVSRQPARVDAAVAALGGEARGQAADLADEASVRALFERLGALDHLVYTAGEALPLAPLATTDIATVRRFFDTRYWGAYMVAKYGSPHVRAGGSITLTSGSAGLRPGPGWTVAASVCGAMEALTRALAVELAPLRVNAVCPGVVKTDLWAGMPADARAAFYRDHGAQLLVERIGEPEEIARTYLYLMSETYSTGQMIVVDGGATLV